MSSTMPLNTTPSNTTLSTTLHVLALAVALLFAPLVANGQELRGDERARLDARFHAVLEAEASTAAGLQAPGAAPPVLSTTDALGQPVATYGAAIYLDDARDVQALRRAGIAVNSVLPSFVTARVTVQDLRTLARMSNVRYVDAGSVLYPANDVTTGWTGARMLQDRFLNNTAYRGQGTMVCVIDSGIDWAHEDFREVADPTNSRIRYLWDQTLTASGAEQTPQQRGGSDFGGFTYGVEYSRADIENEIDGTAAGFVRSQDTDGHGTHVTGTAAGSGGAHPEGKYAGMAPEADIIVVKAGNDSFPFSNVIDGMNYCGEVAADEGKPVVVNMSLGTAAGPHDGTTAQDVAVDNFVGSGRVVVVAAGNDGDSGMHLRRSVPASSSAQMSFSLGSYTPEPGADNDDIFFDVWFDTGDAVTVEVTTPTGTQVTQASGNFSTTSTTDGAVFLSNRINTANGDRNVQIRIFDEDASTTPRSGTWTIRFTDDSGSGNGFHSWLVDPVVGSEVSGDVVVNGREIEGSPMTAAVASLSGGDNQYTIGSPGTATKAVTAGSFVHRWRWESTDGSGYLYSNSSDRTDDISTFSSLGPRRDGVQKPEITAPGQAMGSALSSTQTPAPSDVLVLPGDKHYVTQGTSMASPAVAGAVALLLQDDPSLTADRVKDLLINNATRDDYTGTVPNSTWGYGKLDAFRAMGELTGSIAAEREMLAYDDPFVSSQMRTVTVGGSGAEKLAVRMTPAISGSVTGVSLHLAGGTANRLTDSLNVEIWSSDDLNNDLPRAKLGNTVKVPAAELMNFSVNFVSMIEANVAVTRGINYHVVVYPNVATDEIDLAAEVASVDQRSSALTSTTTTSIRLQHARAQSNGNEWAAPASSHTGTWGSISSDLTLRTFVSSTQPSNLVVDISSLDFTFVDPTLPSPVRFVASVSVQNNGTPVRGLGPSDFTVEEDGTNLPVSLSDATGCTFTPPSVGGTRLADIVFIIDNSGSMGFEQDDVIDNIITFVNELDSRGVDFALGLTRYGQSSTGTLGQVGGGPIFEDNGILTEDADRFKNEVLTRNITSGGNEPGYYSIAASVQNFSFRPGAKKIFIIATDETPAQSTSLGDLDDARTALVGADVTLYASTTSGLTSTFQPLTDDTGGQIFDIFDDFSTTVADAITGQVSSTYILSCLSPTEFLGTEAPPTSRLVDVSAAVGSISENDTSSYDPGGRPRLEESREITRLLRRAQADDLDLTIETDIQTFTGPAIQSATLFYRVAQTGGAYSSVPMTVAPASSAPNAATAASTRYQGVIPAAAVQSPGMEFYLRASDGSSSVTLPNTNATSNPLSVAVLPNEPPVLTHDLVERTTPGQDALVTAQVEDQTNQVAQVSLFYRMQGNLTYRQIEMTNTTGTTYEATVPGSEVTSAGIEYYIRATDDFDVSTTAGTPDVPLAELVSPSLVAPGDQTLGLPVDVEVTFNSVSRAVEYEAHLSLDQTFPEADTDTFAVADTTLTFGGLTQGDTYYWRVRPLRSSSYPGPFSDVRSFTTYPASVAASVTRSFGDPSQSTSYRLVALPGNRSTGVASLFSGAPDEDWQAYWDTGSDADFFVPFDGTDTFTFEPGRGFWVLGSSELTVSDTAPAVALGADFTATIPLHAGWNIVSNPLDRDVDWAAVNAANGGSIQTLWTWDGSFAEAPVFASAASGEAYYFLNNQGLQELVLPYPNAPQSSTTTPAQKSGTAFEIVLSTLLDERRTSVVAAGLHPDARAGLDAFDQFAPPARFEGASLRLSVPSGAADSLSKRQSLLAREYRAAGKPGYTFALTLHAQPNVPVTVRAEGLGEGDAKVALLNPATGALSDLRVAPSTRIVPRSKTTPLQLLVGSAEYVEAKREAVLPAEVALLQNYPNPFSESTTIEFALPAQDNVRMTVYDVLGRRVAVLADGSHRAGSHRIQWQSGSGSQGALASGLYLVRLETSSATRMMKMMVVR
jgi:subtilisin family serine protease